MNVAVIALAMIAIITAVFFWIYLVIYAHPIVLSLSLILASVCIRYGIRSSKAGERATAGLLFSAAAALLIFAGYVAYGIYLYGAGIKM